MDALVGWARDYCRAVLVEGHVGRKRDETITAALVSAAALEHGNSLSQADLHRIRNAAIPLLYREIQPGRVPFDSPAYGAAIVLGSLVLHVDIPGGTATLRAVAESYMSGGRVDRPVGVAFVADALGRAGLRDELREFRARVIDQLGTATLSYEARIYLAQAAWVASESVGMDAQQEAAPLIVEALGNSPVYEVIATGQDVVGADGPDGELRKVSPLYLASIYDLAVSHERSQAELARREREARYVSARGHAWFSFIGVLVVTVAPAVLATWLAWPTLGLAANVYLRQQFWLAPDAQRLASAIVVIAWYGFLVIVGTIADVAFRLARRRVVSDAHLVDEVRRVLPSRLWKSWVLALVFGLVAVGWNLISASVQAPPIAPPVDSATMVTRQTSAVTDGEP